MLCGVAGFICMELKCCKISVCSKSNVLFLGEVYSGVPLQQHHQLGGYGHSNQTSFRDPSFSGQKPQSHVPYLNSPIFDPLSPPQGFVDELDGAGMYGGSLAAPLDNQAPGGDGEGGGNVGSSGDVSQERIDGSLTQAFEQLSTNSPTVVE